jgi:hypothetical protein
VLGVVGHNSNGVAVVSLPDSRVCSRDIKSSAKALEPRGVSRSL